MKQHISTEDLNSLTNDQKQRLKDWWVPQKYDLSAAYVCRDASQDIYEYIDFVIGEVVMEGLGVPRTIKTTVVYDRYRISLRDLKTMGSNKDNTCTDDYSDEEDEGSLETDDTEYESDDESFEEDDSFDELELTLESQQVELYDKKECLPLLNIGQMIEFLKESTRKTLIIEELQNSELFSVSFYYKFDRKYESEELCNCLWEAVRETL